MHLLGQHSRDGFDYLSAARHTRQQARRWSRVGQANVAGTVRIVADVVMLNCALIVALILRYLWLTNLQPGLTDPRRELAVYIHAYITAAPIITLLCLAIFAVSGFYTRGRGYRSRYKALMVAQAVTSGYLCFVFVSYLAAGSIDLPRSVTPIAWLLSLVLLGGARVWSHVWTATVASEKRAIAPTDRSIRHVLVIGGDGYIGSALLPKLLAKGYRVRVLSLLLYGTEPIADLIGHPRLQVVKADFRQVDKVVEAMRDIDAVVHLGAIVGDPACTLDEDLTIDVNLMATRMIAEVAKGNGVNRFIFASTCSVYGASDEILTESSQLRPVSLYAQTKIACERLLSSMADSTFAPVLLRFGTIYGLSGRTRFDLVVNLLTAKAMVDGEITVVGGDQWRPFVHVDDAAEAVLKVLRAPLPSVRNEIFNVGSDDQNFTIMQIGKLINQLVPSARLLDWSTDGDRRNYRVSFSKIRNQFGFTPHWTIEQGIQQVIEAIKCGKVGDYRDAKYSNVKFLSEEGLIHRMRRDSNWAVGLLTEWNESASPAPVQLRAELVPSRANQADPSLPPGQAV